MEKAVSARVDLVLDEDEEFDFFYEEFENEQKVRKPVYQSKPINLFPTSLGFRLTNQIVLMGDNALVKRKNHIVYAIDAEWRVCKKLSMFLEYLIQENQNDPIYYARMAVRFIRKLLLTPGTQQRMEHWSVLLGGFDSDTPMEPLLYRANKVAVETIKESTSIGDYRHFLDLVLSKKKFHRDMSVSDVTDIGESFRAMVKKSTTEVRVTDILTSVVISPSALGESSHQPSSSVACNDQGSQDAKNAKRYGKVGKQIVTAVTNGGPNPVLNTVLATILERAKLLDVPKEILERYIEKASEKGLEAFVGKLYRVNGHGGVEMVVESFADDVNRFGTAIYQVVERYGTNMADSDEILFNFKRAWAVHIKVTDVQLDQLRRLASDCCASEPTVYEDGFERYYKIVCRTGNNYKHIVPKLQERGIAFEPDYVMLPLRKCVADAEAMGSNDALMSRLLELEDVDAVYTNQFTLGRQ